MAKAQVHKVQASDQIVAVARELKEARTNSARWGEIADIKKEDLRDLLGYVPGDGSVEAVTAAGIKVASVTESTRMLLDEDAFKRDHPDIDLNEYKTRPSIAATVKVHDV